MEKDRGIVIVGSGSFGQTTAMVLAKKLARENTAVIVVDEKEQRFADISQPGPMLIKNYHLEEAQSTRVDFDFDLPKHKKRAGNNAKRKHRKNKTKKTHK